MTLKEKVEQVCPEAVDDTYIGGVKGCPGDYDFLTHQKQVCGNCLVCWSQEYREREKRFNASAVFIALAVLEALWSIIAVVRGDSEWLRFCCVMGLLYIVAAGVWRTNQ